MRAEDKNLKTAVIIITSITLIAVVMSVGMLSIVENPSGFLEKLSITITLRLAEKLFEKIRDELRRQ